MKSLVTKRTVSVSPTGVSGPPMPDGVFQMPSTAGAVPLQWNVTLRPLICGKRPVPPANVGSQNGVNPLRKAVFIWAPVRVSITVRFPKGRTANISPQVISPFCSPALGGL
jgi:hypothetical protein